MKPAPFQQSLKQKVKKITTKHHFLPQIKQIWALVEKIQPSAHGGKGPEPRRERQEGDAVEISPSGDSSLSKLGDHLQRQMTRGMRCLVLGGLKKQPGSRGFGLCLGQTHEAGAASAPAVPVSEILGIPRVATRKALGDSGFNLFFLFAFFQERWGPEFLLLFGG